jgi:hypothetical protein
MPNLQVCQNLTYKYLWEIFQEKKRKTFPLISYQTRTPHGTESQQGKLMMQPKECVYISMKTEQDLLCIFGEGEPTPIFKESFIKMS